jgi:hypothetical protein
MMHQAPFTRVADAAFALIEAHRDGKTKLTRKAGNFLGECVVDGEQPLSQRQGEWISTLLNKAGLPAIDGLEARHG